MSHDVEVLNRLVSRLHAAAAAYRRAGADGAGLSDATSAAADGHERTAEELAAVARLLGASPGENVAQTSREAWDDLPRAAAAGPRAVAEAMERAEGALLAAFREAMDDGEVSGPVRDAVVRASNGVMAGRDRALRRLDALAP